MNNPYSHVIVADQFGRAWEMCLDRLLNHGDRAVPREKRTLEIVGASIRVDQLRNNIVLSELRDLNYRFMVAEWAWICAGREDVAWIARYNKAIANFSDDGNIFNGAYGPRLAPQWDYILNILQRQDSRQAVAVIWTPSPKDSKDIPCTISFQFLLRDGVLHMIATMRSSDVWLGLPYDFFNFSMIANGIAGELGVETGSLTMQLGSLHIYDNNWEAAGKLLDGEYVSTLESPKLPWLPTKSFLVNPLNPPAEMTMKAYWDILHTVSTKAQALEVLHAASRLG